LIDHGLLEEWSYDAALLVDYEPKATLWDLFKFEYLKLYGELPAGVEVDYPNKNVLQRLVLKGLSPEQIAENLGIERWLVVEALEFYNLDYCTLPIDASGIVEAYVDGEKIKKNLARRFRTTVYFVDKALKINGVT
jgi:hypothetical protein